MNSILRQTILHGLEVVGATAAAVALQYTADNIIPILSGQWPWVGMITVPLIAGFLKWLRANPNIKIPDYVAGTK